jgi:hypothetical protein
MQALISFSTAWNQGHSSLSGCKQGLLKPHKVLVIDVAASIAGGKGFI